MLWWRGRSSWAESGSQMDVDGRSGVCSLGSVSMAEVNESSWWSLRESLDSAVEASPAISVTCKA